ncbi:MAG TPA: PH domain-containing protein [Bryobacteraceae bacterium]|nr:PH domain-containing protein [Bryobacteraceae bacterium]
MADIVIRPSLKFVKAGYLAVLLIIVAVTFLYFHYRKESYPSWPPAVSVLLLLWPLKRHLERQTVKLTIAGEKLRYETGLATRSTRIIQLPKVQDVRVIQSLTQRMFDVGHVSIETAGESSRLLVENLDRPQQLAEQITDASANASPGGGVH